MTHELFGKPAHCHRCGGEIIPSEGGWVHMPNYDMADEATELTGEDYTEDAEKGARALDEHHSPFPVDGRSLEEHNGEVAKGDQIIRDAMNPNNRFGVGSSQFNRIYERNSKPEKKSGGEDDYPYENRRGV